jgi:hypothetical protein
MQTGETPDRQPEEPQADHHFQTPVVREARPAQPTGADRRRRPEPTLASDRLRDYAAATDIRAT